MNTVIYSPDLGEKVNILAVIDLLQSENTERVLILLDDSDAKDYGGFSYLGEQFSKEVAMYCLNQNEDLHRVILYLSSICTMDTLCGESDAKSFEEIIHMLKVLSCYLALSFHSDKVNLFVNRYQEYLKAYQQILAGTQQDLDSVISIGNIPLNLGIYELSKPISQNDISFKRQLNKIPSTEQGYKTLYDILDFLNLGGDEKSSPKDFEGKTGLLRSEIIQKLEIIFQHQDSIRIGEIDFGKLNSVMYNS